MSRRNALRDHVRAGAENRPGVYRFIGPSGEVLYIGKSIKLRCRLLSYFRCSRGEKGAEILGHAHGIEWDYAPSEFAALLHELELIKRWRPIYNVEHKRDRVYCFVKLTREPAPRLLLVGQVARDGALYFGPFRGSRRMAEVVREISDLLELRDCPSTVRMRFADQMDLFPLEERSRCMRADLHRCLAPCAARCTSAQYRARVALARRFLEGDADRPLAILRERMLAAAERMQFEYAAELRDRMRRLEEARDTLVARRGSVDAMTFLYPVAGYRGDDRLYLIRRGRVRGEFPAPRTTAERQELSERIGGLLSTPELDPGILRPHDVAEILLVDRWFRLRPAEKERLVAPESLLEARQTA